MSLLSTRLLLIKVKQQFFGFFHSNGTSNSKFGLMFQLLGLGAFLYGSWLVYHPAAFLLGGVLALIAGERL